jgi:hypothetical protein
MTIFPYLHPPTPPDFKSFPEVTQWTRRMWDSYFRTRQGKMDCITELTLTANSATTVFSDIRLSVQSVVTFDPKTATAATELYGATMYVLTANRNSETWTITHANNATTDRTFQVSIIG